MGVKIGFMGTHGVGKTSTVQWLSDIVSREGYFVDVVNDSARDCPMPINKETTQESQIWILLEQIQQEVFKRYSDFSEVVISDRTALDALVYTYVNLGKNDFMKGVVDEWMNTYDLLFKMKRKKEYLEDDGLRDTDLEFWKEVDERMSNMINEMELDGRILKVESKEPKIKNRTLELLEEKLGGK